MEDKKCCRKLIFDNIKYNSKKCTGKGEKATELFPVSIFSKGGFMISHVLSYLLARKEKVRFQTLSGTQNGSTAFRFVRSAVLPLFLFNQIILTGVQTVPQLEKDFHSIF